MDKTLEKIYSMTDEEIQAGNKRVMLGSGGHGVCFTSGKGVYLNDNNGKRYIDCTSQGWALFLGHSNDEIRQIAYEQMAMIGHLNQNSDNLPRYYLAEKLTELAPANLNRAYFTVGGSAAIEAALKIAVKNVPGARKFVSLYDGYHGTSLTTGASSWISTKTAGMFTGFNSFLNILNDIFVRVPNPFIYRFPNEDADACIKYCLDTTRATIANAVSGPVAGIICEPLQASGGQIPLPKEYLQGLRQICDEFGCLLIFDELQTYCRIGDFFAANKYEVEPDIICLGKSLGAGFPIAAILIHDRLEGFGPLGEDIHTFQNNAIAQVAAAKQIEIIQRDNLLENTNYIGAYIADKLNALKTEYPQIGDVRQAGLHIGVEFVTDSQTKQPELKLAQTLKQVALSNGLILGEAGYRMNVLKIKPPLIITKDEADEVLNIFEGSLKAALVMQ